MKKFLILTLILSLTKFANAQQSDAIIGEWNNQEKTATILIFKKSGLYFGKIQTSPESGKTKPANDEKNPNKNLRSNPIIGLEILKGFVFTKNKMWEQGTIYDPNNGKTYSSYIKMVDYNTLDIRGYVGVSLLGRTTSWTRKQ